VECVFGYVASSVDRLSRSLQMKTLDGLYVREFGAFLGLRNISPYLLNDDVPCPVFASYRGVDKSLA
jgi:hypothetical protein